jgi:sugar lactone lactonase YvrE
MMSGISNSQEPVWLKLGGATLLGATHGGVAMDREGRMYCSTDGPRSVIVFAPDGSTAHQFAPEFAGIHALTVGEEAGEEFLLCAHLAAHRVVKLTLDGRLVWTLGAPMESGLYRVPEDFKPTAAVLGPDGELFIADGYGASVVHQFDEHRRYLKSFGGPEAGAGQLRNCHCLALDQRKSQPLLLVCDRRNRRLVHYDLNGRFVGVMAENLRRPCSVSFFGDYLAVAELEGRVAILDRADHIVALLGDNPDQTQWANYEVPSSEWQPGVFNAPHSVCFDPDGNLVVSEWNHTGRITRLLQFPIK